MSATQGLIFHVHVLNEFLVGLHFSLNADETQVRHACSFVCKKEKATRLHPWYTEEPTEEEKEKMDASRGGGTKKTDILSVIMPEVEKITWDLSNPKSIKTTTKSLVKILRESGRVNISEDKNAQMQVGRIILAERDSSPEDVCKVIVEKLGVKKTKEEEKAKKNKVFLIFIL